MSCWITLIVSDLAVIFQPGILHHRGHDMRPAESAVSKDVVKFLIDHEASFVFGMTMVSFFLRSIELTDRESLRVKTAGPSPLWGPRTTLALDPRRDRTRLDRITGRRPQHRHPLRRSDGGDLAKTCGRTRRHEVRADRPSSGERAETATRPRSSTPPAAPAVSPSRRLCPSTLSPATTPLPSHVRSRARRSVRTQALLRRHSRSADGHRARAHLRRGRR